jgi:apolipoprotein N-acyltransferase
LFNKLKIPILILLAAIVLFSGYQMWNLPLWGHRPLFFFAALWAFMIILLEKRFSKLPDNRTLLGWSTLSGIILAAGFPISPLTPLMFVGFVPLLMVEKRIAESREGPAKWEVFKYAFHAFVVWNIFTAYWVANSASFAGGVIAVWLNALFMSVPFVLFHQTRKMMPRNFMYIAFIANWLAWEYLHLRWEISWPWLTLGNSFAQYPSWVQWYEYTGVFGGSLWILVANLLIFKWIAMPFFFEKQKASGLNYIKIAGLILLPIIASVIWYANYEESGREVEVVAVQPNYEPHYQKFSVNKFVQLDRYIQLSRSQLTQNTAYLVFPETSFGGLDKDKLAQNQVIEKLNELLDDYPKLKLVMGIASYKIYKEGEELGNAMRQQIDKRTGRVINWEAYNAAIQLESGSEEIQFYKKGKFVPGAEIFPFSSLLFFGKAVVDQLGGTLAGYGTQAKRTPLTSDSGKIGAAICYESIYGEFYGGYVREGAEAIFIVTNDGWWDDTPGHKQLLQHGSLRAIETRKDIARSANTGISAFINQRGDISQTTKYEEAIAIRGNIKLNNIKTFYVLWGDIIGRLAIFTCILLLLNTFVKGKLNKETI